MPPVRPATRSTTRPTTRPAAVRRHVVAVGVAVLAVAVVLTGCGSTGTTTTANVPAVQTTTTGPDDATTPATEPASTPAEGATDPSGEATSGTPSAEASQSAAPDATQQPSAKPTQTPTAQPTQTPTAQPTQKPRPSEHKDLRSGDSGARVKKLQQDLESLGYWISGVDGKFGPSTLQAVWAVQKAAGLGRDGVVGANTRKAIADGVRPAAKTHSGHVIEVDLAKQLLLLVDDGHVSTILNASSGSGKPFKDKAGNQYVAHTPAGTFHVGRQFDGMYTSNLGLGQMWRPKFFNGGIAIHGLGYDVPPYPASHGCVRVSNPAMDWIWSTNKAPQGTEVLVY